MRSAMVTGVAGMIGSHLLDELIARGYRVLGVDNLTYGKLENIEQHLSNPNFTLHRVDIEDLDALRILARDVDMIVHLAAVKKTNEAQSNMRTLTVNAKGTENVFEVGKMWSKKVVYASTSDVYGMTPELPFREDGNILLGTSTIKRWAYAVSKLYGEHLAFSYASDFGLKVVVIRYFGGFSPRSSFSWSGGHIPIFINAVLNDEEVPIHGDGNQTRSMAFVNDLVSGTVMAMENERAVGEIINLGSAEEMSVIESARLIHRLAKTGKELRLKMIPMEEVFGQYRDIMRRIPDLSKAKRLLGYEPKYSTRDAIQITLDEVKKRRSSKTK